MEVGNLAFLSNYFTSNSDVRNHIQMAETPGSLIKTLWVATNTAERTRTVQRREHLPKNNGMECVEFFDKILQFSPENKKDQKLLYELQDATFDLLKKKSTKGLLSKSINDTFLDAENAYKVQKAGRISPEEKPVSLEKKADSVYSSIHSTDGKKRTRDNDKDSKGLPPKKKATVGEPDQTPSNRLQRHEDGGIIFTCEPLHLTEDEINGPLHDPLSGTEPDDDVAYMTAEEYEELTGNKAPGRD